MKNNIGRKLTSLTLMTIMFAGGMTAAVPSMMPGIFAEGASSAGGLVSVSSTGIQGASVLEIVIDDPAISALDTAIGVPSLTYGGGATKSLTPAQAVDGKWYSYIVDDGQSTLADAMSGLNFGTDCATTTFTLSDGTTLGNSADGTWALATNRCTDPDGPADATTVNALNTNNAYTGQVLEVLNDAPSINKNSSANNGQIYASSNSTVDTDHRASGSMGAWPFIEQVTLASDNVITYGGETVNFTHGNLNGDISVTFEPDTYANGADINLVINDMGLNIDPTELDKWVFEELDATATIKRSFANGTTGSALVMQQVSL